MYRDGYTTVDKNHQRVITVCFKLCWLYDLHALLLVGYNMKLTLRQRERPLLIMFYNMIT
ncbi:hypothetical protein M6B38_277310 [Iris pallida]|uniref:Uncharacterized protein n=1 Tax=Iris pallida TaxID=29817 RepID=A0AAX6I2S5_IRIPA|nr:hypothetical protein M6B38_277310 [Iris pallida]